MRTIIKDVVEINTQAMDNGDDTAITTLALKNGQEVHISKEMCIYVEEVDHYNSTTTMAVVVEL